VMDAGPGTGLNAGTEHPGCQSQIGCARAASGLRPRVRAYQRRFCTLCTIKQENRGDHHGCPDRPPHRHAGR
jgi:hypothetical protein